jgi:hypothetical protein
LVSLILLSMNGLVLVNGVRVVWANCGFTF